MPPAANLRSVGALHETAFYLLHTANDLVNSAHGQPNASLDQLMDDIKPFTKWLFEYRLHQSDPIVDLWLLVNSPAGTPTALGEILRFATAVQEAIWHPLGRRRPFRTSGLKQKELDAIRTHLPRITEALTHISSLDAEEVDARLDRELLRTRTIGRMGEAEAMAALLQLPPTPTKRVPSSTSALPSSARTDQPRATASRSSNDQGTQVAAAAESRTTEAGAPPASGRLPGPDPYPVRVENHEQLADSLAAKLATVPSTGLKTEDVDTSVSQQEAAVLKALLQQHPARQTVGQLASILIFSEQSIGNYLKSLQSRNFVTPPANKTGRTLTSTGLKLAQSLPDTAGNMHFRKCS